MTSPTRFIPPWATDFTNEANNAWAVVTDVVGDVTGGTVVLPPSPLPTVPTPVPVPVPVPTTVPTLPTTIPATGVTDIQGAINAILPALESNVGTYLEQYLAAVLAGKVPSAIPNVTYDGQSLTHQAASSHAIRTFLIGMSTSALSAVLSAVGSEAHLDFFSKSGWMATGTLVVGTLVSTVTSYIARLQITPDFEAKLLAAPPGVVKKG